MRGRKLNQAAFSLVELLVVIAVVGILAAVAIPSFDNYREKAKISAAAEELKGLRAAFYAYLADNEDLPADVGGGTIPAGMADYIPNGIFSNGTPLGGRYNWDGLPGHNPPGISIESPSVSITVMQSLDSFLDDGSLGTGQFVVTGDGHYKLIIEPG